MEGKTLASMPLESLLRDEGVACSCKRLHKSPVRQIEVGKDILWKIAVMAKERGMKSPVVIADQNTQKTGKMVCGILEEAGIQPVFFVMDSGRPEPDEFWVGSLALQFDRRWDGIVAVGSGTINDICKIVANMTGLPYLMAATAPSMDGYASNTSSMLRGGVKVSLPSKCPDGILLDTAILARAPMEMIQAGIGDMAAKYVSICEWKIAHIITGEYYCGEIAELVKMSLKTCMDSSAKLAARDEDAAGDTAFGLVLSGIAMSYAGISRPASGTEHYFSHIWEMRALQQKKPRSLHGISVGVGTLLTIPVLKYIGQLEPDRERALRHAEDFDPEEWKAFVRRVFGTAADTMILREDEEKKYDKTRHKERLEIILSRWDEIQKIIREELPDEEWLKERLLLAGAPVSPAQLGLSADDVRTAFLATKDIRDKYISTRLLWDLGMLEEAADRLFGSWRET